MTDAKDTAKPIDGRTARRQRNVDAVLDVVLEMFAENSMYPTMEQAAQRSGLSLRSLYRYFEHPGDLTEAAISRNREVNRSQAHLPSIGKGPLDKRIRDFVTMRVALADSSAAVYRATVVNAMIHPRIEEEQRINVDAMHKQFLRQFAPELDGLAASRRRHVAELGDLMTQLSSILHLREQRDMSPRDVRTHLSDALHDLLG